jgi:hypothetical protein
MRLMDRRARTRLRESFIGRDLLLGYWLNLFVDRPCCNVVADVWFVHVGAVVVCRLVLLGKRFVGIHA